MAMGVATHLNPVWLAGIVFPQQAKPGAITRNTTNGSHNGIRHMSELQRDIHNNCADRCVNEVLGVEKQQATASAQEAPATRGVPEVQTSAGDHDLVVIDCRAATDEETAIDEELKALAKHSLTAQNEFLARMLPIITALLGGGLVLAKGDVIPQYWAVATMAALLLSLVFTLYGLSPNEFKHGSTLLESKVNYLNAQEAAGIKKTWSTTWAVRCFVAAMFIGIVGIAYRDAPPPQPTTQTK